ncbi:MAG TPA: hypothetical protein DD670_08570 [Planctomycetaceae bacterium]|nr:hypothetical protein [Planctomycetaceae bacterium]
MSEPYCLAMVLCDNVHRDAATGKHTILGTFSTLGAGKYPAKVSFCVYFAITDGLGPTKLRIRLVDAACGITDEVDGETEPVFEVSHEFPFESPLVVLEGMFQFKTEIPKAGLYHCEMWAGGELLMSRRVLAAQVSDHPEEDKGVVDHE